MVIKTERGLPSSVGHLYRPLGGRQAERQDDDGEELKKRLSRTGMSRRFDIVRSELFMKRSARCLTG